MFTIYSAFLSAPTKFNSAAYNYCMNCSCNARLAIALILIVCVAIVISIAIAIAVAKFKFYLVNQLRIEILFRDCNNNTNDFSQD